MDPDTARQMFEEGAVLVLLGMPIGTEFGIDMNSWNVAEKFRGVKMIPPGLHFIYYSAVSRQGDIAPRTGFFHVFKQREILVRHYDPAAEDLKTEEKMNEEEEERIRSNLQNMDPFLGAYPLESWKKWVSLTHHVPKEQLERMVPLSGKICSVPELIRVDSGEENTPGASCSKALTDGSSMPCRKALTSDSKKEIGDSANEAETDVIQMECNKMQDTDGKVESITEYSDEQPDTKIKIPPLPNMIQRPGTEMRFSKFPKHSYPDGASPSEITHYSLDSSHSIRHLIKDQQPEFLLGELQFAFVCFLVGQVWDGWEHWRQLVAGLCSAEEFLQKNPVLYEKFLSVLHFQIHEVPEDLFVDIVESNNFLAAALTSLFANVSDNSDDLPSSLVTKARKFKGHLTNKFKWNLTLEDEGEDAPVVVEI